MNKIKDFIKGIIALVIIFGGYFAPMYLLIYCICSLWGNIWFGKILNFKADEIDE